ncbi:MAG: hypothetical protein ETSY1_09360 [Candidatus Entotheonella factor]|uniref:Uncharacterized protein n=1 Tax=Entotheonella factor TaxID=1429438 RepID=W4LTB5_ENTF1|nr:MAG: hypothetical protein ETSY1_09360 [Candidatus Entotheonella factor]
MHVVFPVDWSQNLTSSIALTFELGFGANVERLQNTCIDGSDHIHSTVQIGFVNTCFPCIRKAAFHSRLTVAHHGNRKAHEDLFTFTQIVNGVSIAVKLPEISSLNHRLSPCLIWMMPHLLARRGLDVPL